MMFPTPLLPSKLETSEGCGSTTHPNRSQSWYKKLCRPGTQLPPQEDEEEQVQPSPQRLQLQMHFQREYQQRQELSKNCKQEWWQRNSGPSTPGPQTPVSYQTPSPMHTVYSGDPFLHPPTYQRTPHYLHQQARAPQTPSTVFLAGNAESERGEEKLLWLERELFDQEKRLEREKMIRAASMIKQDIERRVRESKRESVMTPREQEMNQRKMIVQRLKELELAERLKASNQNRVLRQTPNANPEFQQRLASLVHAPYQSTIQQRIWQEQVSMYNNMLQSYSQGNAQQSYQHAKSLLQQMLQKDSSISQRRQPTGFNPSTPQQQAAYHHQPQHAKTVGDNFGAAYVEQAGHAKLDPRLNRSSQMHQAQLHNTTPRLNQSSRQYSEPEQDTSIEILYRSGKPGTQDRIRRNSTPRKAAENGTHTRDENSDLLQKLEDKREPERQKERSPEKQAANTNVDKDSQQQSQRTEDSLGVSPTAASDGQNEKQQQGPTTKTEVEPSGRLLDWEQMQQRSQRHRRRRGMRFGSEEQTRSTFLRQRDNEERRNELEKKRSPSSRQPVGSEGRNIEKRETYAFPSRKHSVQDKHGKQSKRVSILVDSPSDESPVSNQVETSKAKTNVNHVTERAKATESLPEQSKNAEAAMEVGVQARKNSSEMLDNSDGFCNDVFIESVCSSNSQQEDQESELLSAVHDIKGTISKDKINFSVERSPDQNSELFKQQARDESTQQAPSFSQAKDLDDQTSSVDDASQKPNEEKSEKTYQATETEMIDLRSQPSDIPTADPKQQKATLRLNSQDQEAFKINLSNTNPSSSRRMKLHSVGGDEEKSALHPLDERKSSTSTHHPPRITRQVSRETQNPSDVAYQNSAGTTATQAPLPVSRRRQESRYAPRSDKTGLGKQPAPKVDKKLPGTEPDTESPGNMSARPGKRSPGSTYVVRNSSSRPSLKSQSDPQEDGPGKSKSSGNTLAQSEAPNPKAANAKPQSAAGEGVSPPSSKSRRHRSRRRPWQREESFNSLEKSGAGASRTQNRSKPRSLDRDQPLSWRSSSPKRLPPRTQKDWRAEPRRRPYQWEESRAGPSKKWKTSSQQNGSATARVHPYRQANRFEGRKVPLDVGKSIKSTTTLDHGASKLAQNQQSSSKITEESKTDGKSDMPDRSSVAEEIVQNKHSREDIETHNDTSSICKGDTTIGVCLGSAAEKMETGRGQEYTNKVEELQTRTDIQKNQVQIEENPSETFEFHECKEKEMNTDSFEDNKDSQRVEAKVGAEPVTVPVLEKRTDENRTDLQGRKIEKTELQQATEDRWDTEKGKAQNKAGGKKDRPGSDVSFEGEAKQREEIQASTLCTQEDKVETSLEHVLYVLGRKGRGDESDGGDDDDEARRENLHNHESGDAAEEEPEESHTPSPVPEREQGNLQPASNNNLSRLSAGMAVGNKLAQLSYQHPQSIDVRPEGDRQCGTLEEKVKVAGDGTEGMKMRPSATSAEAASEHQSTHLPATVKILLLEEMEDWLSADCMTSAKKSRDSSIPIQQLEKDISEAQSDDMVREQQARGPPTSPMQSIGNKSSSDNTLSEEAGRPERFEHGRKPVPAVDIKECSNSLKQQSNLPEPSATSTSQSTFLEEEIVSLGSEIKVAFIEIPSANGKARQQAEADGNHEKEINLECEGTQEQNAYRAGEVVGGQQMEQRAARPVISSSDDTARIGIHKERHQQPDSTPAPHENSTKNGHEFGKCSALHTNEKYTMDIGIVTSMDADSTADGIVTSMDADSTAESPSSDTPTDARFIDGIMTAEELLVNTYTVSSFAPFEIFDPEQDRIFSTDRDTYSNSKPEPKTLVDGITGNCSSGELKIKLEDTADDHKIMPQVPFQIANDSEDIDALELQKLPYVPVGVCDRLNIIWDCDFMVDENEHILVDRLTASGYI